MNYEEIYDNFKFEIDSGDDSPNIIITADKISPKGKERVLSVIQEFFKSEKSNEVDDLILQKVEEIKEVLPSIKKKAEKREFIDRSLTTDIYREQIARIVAERGVYSKDELSLREYSFCYAIIVNLKQSVLDEVKENLLKELKLTRTQQKKKSVQTNDLVTDLVPKNIFLMQHSNNGSTNLKMNFLKLRDKKPTGMLQDRVSHSFKESSSKIDALIEIRRDLEGTDYIPSFLQVKDLTEVTKGLRASQIQLADYIEAQMTQTNKTRIKIDIDDYFKLRGIKRRTETVENFLADVRALSRLWLDIPYEYGEQKGRLSGPFLAVTGLGYSGENKLSSDLINGKKLLYVSVVLGDWSEKLLNGPYTLTHKEYFKLNPSPKKDEKAILLSHKFGQMIRASLYNKKLKPDDQLRLKVSNAFELFGINKEQMTGTGSKGYSYYEEILENALDKLQTLGYDWRFENAPHNNVNELWKDNIVFTNVELIKTYNESMRDDSVKKPRRTRKKRDE
jgi:hypothetical protein